MVRAAAAKAAAAWSSLSGRADHAVVTEERPDDVEEELPATIMPGMVVRFTLHA